MWARRRAQRERAAARCGETGGSGALALRSVAARGAGPMRQVVASGAGGSIARPRAVVAAEGDDLLAQSSVRGEDAVVAVAVDAGWRDEAAQRSEKLEGREDEDGAAVAGGSRGVVEDLADAGLA